MVQGGFEVTIARPERDPVQGGQEMVPGGQGLPHRGLQAIAESDAGAGFQAAAGLDQGVPIGPAPGPDQEDLGGASTRSPAQESGRNDPTAVGDEEVAGFEQVGQIPERPVGQAAGFPLEHQEAGGVALGEGLLRDGVGRQVVVEVGDLHEQSGR